MDKPIVIITGATSGFGKAIATKFAREGHPVIITGRRQEKLRELEKCLKDKFNAKVLCLCFDVRHENSTTQALDSLPGDWSAVGILINNAGLASGMDKIQDGDLEDWNKMIDTNVKGILHVSRNIMPGMIKRGSGHIVNIGSTAGKEVYEKGAIYCASKHAVDAISKGMRIDLLEHGIKVTQISPGAAETEFSIVRFHGDTERAKQVYDGYHPMTAEDIAELVWYSCNLPPHLCINDLVVTSLAQANSHKIHRQ